MTCTHLPSTTVKCEVCLQSLATSGCHNTLSGMGWDVCSELISCTSRMSVIRCCSDFQSIKYSSNKLVPFDDYVGKIKLSFCHVASQGYFTELIATRIYGDKIPLIYRRVTRMPSTCGCQTQANGGIYHVIAISYTTEITKSQV